ncbi:MAG: TlpA family protein disulfide reductase [Burkholderiaceae bacterium]|jgi:peroxiredoxin
MSSMLPPSTSQRLLLRRPGAAALAAVLLLCTACGDRAPEVSFRTITGDVFGTAQYRGKVMLVNFWATNCTTCVKEMPKLVATYRRFQLRGFETVAVAMKYDVPSYVVNFATTRQLPFKVALDLDGEAARQYGGIDATPTTFLIDRQGKILKKYVGEPDFEQLNALIDRALQAS